MKFGIIGNTSKSAIEEVTRNLYAYLRAKKLTFVFSDQLGKWFGSTGVAPPLERTMMCTEEDLPDRCDILIALGGDGTMLFAARIVGEKGVPILGINLGKLGFLAEFSVNEIQQCIDDIVSGNYVVEERMALEALGHEVNASLPMIIDRAEWPVLGVAPSRGGGERMAAPGRQIQVATHKENGIAQFLRPQPPARKHGIRPCGIGLR